MNGDTDIDEGRRRLRQWETSCVALQQYDSVLHAQGEVARWHLVRWLMANAAAMFDAIETGRQWETIARRTWNYRIEHKATCLISRCTCGLDELESAFRDVADRTPAPTDGA